MPRAPGGATTPRAPGGVTIVVSASPGELRTALLQGGALTEAWVERPGRPDGMGDLHRGRVSALAPAMAGAFIALAGGETGFLPERETGEARRPLAAAVHEGMILPLRVIRAAQGGKGPRVTARVTPTEAARIAAAPPGAPRLVARGMLAVERLAGQYANAAVLVDSAALLARLRGRLGDRARLVPAPAFDDAIEADFDILASAEAPLPGAGRLLIHPTPALTAIDMDAGSAAGARGAHAVLTLNRDALPELARQIRARNLGGAILVDFAGLSPKRREALADPLREALAGDRHARLLGFTHLGLAEIVRDRIHPPLNEVLGRPPSALTRGLAALRQGARDVAARPAARLALRASPGVITALQDLPGALEEFSAEAGFALLLRPDPAARDPSIEEAGHDG
ncbi:ribonuclease E/G [Roseomonas sp. CAU 1739]|uniref:ribonuclease E/G n=1 Tax=Roseomonas sp. CAU 1739 TaxID=3140364 RepID=UPI00325BCC2B